MEFRFCDAILVLIFPIGNVFAFIEELGVISTRSGRWLGYEMIDDLAAAFGQMVRSRRRDMKMNQEELALVSGVGVRFIHDLEAGKATCQLGKALAVGRVLGLGVADMNEPGAAL